MRVFATAQHQPGFLGIENVDRADGFGISVSYWTDLDAIAKWRVQALHHGARNRGRKEWYSHYEIRIARIERVYGWDRADGPGDPMLSGGS